MKISLHIIICCLLFNISGLYSQERRINNVFQLEKTLSDSAHLLDQKTTKAYKRGYWFLTTRFDENGKIDGYVNAVNNYYNSQKSTLGNEEETFSTTSTLETSQLLSTPVDQLIFKYLGPKGLDSPVEFAGTSRSAIGRGWINTIQVIDKDTIYAGARNSGLWYTDDGGNNWENISESEPKINGIRSIIIDPIDPSHIILLVHRVFAGSHIVEYSNGIFETFDHGSSWNSVPVFVNGQELFPETWEQQYAVKLVHKPGDINDMFLVTQRRLFRKISGNDWEEIYYSPIYGNESAWLSDIMFDKTNPNVFYLGGPLVYKMTITPGGITKTNITDNLTGITNDTIRKCLFSIADSYPDKIVFYLNDWNFDKHIVKYESSAYTHLHSFSTTDNRTMVVAASENDKDIIYIGGVYLRMYDEATNSLEIIRDALASGESAADITDYLHVDTRDIQVVTVDGKDRVYVGHDGGVAWGEYNPGTSCPAPKYCWHQISDDGTNGLQTNEFYGISIGNSEELIIQGGTQDNSSFIYDEANDRWLHLHKGDGTEGAVSQTDKNKVITGFGCCNATPHLNLYDILNPTQSNGLTWFNGSLHSQVKLDPGDSDNLYVSGEFDLIKINNCFSSTSFSTSTVLTPANNMISSFAIAKNNNSILYVAEKIDGYNSPHTDHMWRYDPSTSTWINISVNLPQYSDSYVTDIVVDPADDYELWICMGQATNGTEKVFHSTDGGNSWTALSQGYPENIPGNRLLYDHEHGDLYVATDVGIFMWDTNRPSGWNIVNGSIPFKVVTDLEKDYYSDRLIAGTYGRGIWIANLCYDEENPLIIDSDTYMTRHNEICSDIIIRNNSTLTISAIITLSKMGTITIENGSSLIIDGGNLKNGKIIVLNGGNLSVINAGVINLFSGDEVQSELGATLNIDNGSIDLIN